MMIWRRYGSVLFEVGQIGCLVGVLLTCQRALPRKAILPSCLTEVSGVYCAGPDSLWWHNDSGNEPVLYLTDRFGHLLDSLEVQEAEATDWEDLTGDPEGNLYLGDFGNNRNERRDLHILRFDPATKEIGRIDFRFPDQLAFPPPFEEAHFDTEAFFWHTDSLHLFTKAKLGTGCYQTKHYVLPARPGTYVAELRDSLTLPKRVVTAAGISDDGQRVALLAYYFRMWLGFIPITRTSVFVFSDYEDAHFLRGAVRKRRVPKFLAPTQYESLDFYNPDYLLLASERTVLFRQKLRFFKVGRGKVWRP